MESATDLYVRWIQLNKEITKYEGAARKIMHIHISIVTEKFCHQKVFVALGYFGLQQVDRVTFGLKFILVGIFMRID